MKTTPSAPSGPARRGRFTRVSTLVLLSLLAACSGGGGGGQGASHAVGGTVSIQAGTGSKASLSGLVLANGADLLSVASAGAFTMPTAVPYGSTYQVSVSSQPAGMTCTASPAVARTMQTSDVTDVAVVCTPLLYRLGGTVNVVAPSGITRTDQGLVLANAGNGDSYAFTSSASSFMLPTAVPYGSPYALTVTAQPANLNCTVANAAGDMPAADITTIAVTCTNSGVLHKNFLIAPNFNLNSVSVLSQDPVSGALSTTTGGASVGAGPNVIAASPTGKFLFVPNLNDNTMTGFSIDPVQGSLVPVPGSPFNLQSIGQSAIFTPSGANLYVVTGNDVRGFSVDASTGALAPVSGSPYALAGGYAVAVNPQGTRLCVANYSTGLLWVYAIDATSGALNAVMGSPFAIIQTALAMAFDASGTYLYVASNGRGLAAYQLSANGMPTALPGSPYAFAQTGYAVSLDPAGKFVLVASNSDGKVYVWSRDPASGQLAAAAGSPYAAVAGASTVLFDAAGTHVYVYGASSATIAAFAFNAAPGTLTPVAGSPFSNVDGGYSLAIVTTSY